MVSMGWGHVLHTPQGGGFHVLETLFPKQSDGGGPRDMHPQCLCTACVCNNSRPRYSSFLSCPTSSWVGQGTCNLVSVLNRGHLKNLKLTGVRWCLFLPLLFRPAPSVSACIPSWTAAAVVRHHLPGPAHVLRWGLGSEDPSRQHREAALLLLLLPRRLAAGLVTTSEGPELGNPGLAFLFLNKNDTCSIEVT